MRKKLFTVVAFRVHIECDCRDYMHWTLEELMSDPPTYPHECLSCGKIEPLNSIYPCIQTSEETYNEI